MLILSCVVYGHCGPQMTELNKFSSTLIWCMSLKTLLCKTAIKSTGHTGYMALGTTLKKLVSDTKN